MLVAGDGSRARTMVARMMIFVTVGKSALASFRSFQFGGRRSTFSRIVGRAIRSCLRTVVQEKESAGGDLHEEFVKPTSQISIIAESERRDA
jgi:hypothetical protein